MSYRFILLFLFLFMPTFLFCAQAQEKKANKPGWTKLHEQATLGKAQIVAMLLSVGDVDVNAQTASGCTPLHCVITNKEDLSAQDCLDTVNNLLAAQADVNAQAKNGVTPLWLATHYTLEPPLIKTLLDAKAAPNVIVSWQTKKKKGKMRNHFSTPFHQIFRINSEHTAEVAQLFLAADANPTIENDQKESALAKALSFPKLIEKMLKSSHMTQEAVIGARLAALTKTGKSKQENKKIKKSEKLLEKYQKNSPAPSPKSAKIEVIS